MPLRAPSHRILLLRVLLPLVVMPAMGWLIYDLMTCGMANARLSLVAEAAAQSALHVLGRPNGTAAQARAAALRRIQSEPETTAGAEPTIEIAGDRRSVTVTLRRPGLLCWSQLVGLAENRPAVETAALLPRGTRREPSSGSGCPLSFMIPC